MQKKIKPSLKAKIALEALQGHRTVAEIASQYGVHPNFVTRVKTEAAKNMESIFNQGNDKKIQELEKERGELLNIIGEKEMDIKWLKKSANSWDFCKKDFHYAGKYFQYISSMQSDGAATFNILLSAQAVECEGHRDYEYHG